MNILIVGEFSGFAKHLKNGFKKLGHQVTIVMAPDSFKKFHGDSDDILYGYNLSIFGHSIKGTARLLNPIRAFFIRLKLDNRYRKKCPDLIIVINYRFITTSRLESGTPLAFLEKQQERGSKLIMTCCGADPAFNYSYPELLKRWGYDMKTRGIHDDRFSWLLHHANTIIPIAIIYYDSILNYAKLEKFDIKKIHHSIPLPITIDNGCVFHPIEERKILIFHGIVRPADKGTSFITKAMDKLQKEMPEKVKCVCCGGLPYDEYIKIFDKVDILVDQAYGRGFGMNALIGAMKGKCVLVSNPKENMYNMGIKENPFIEIGPNSDQIYLKLKELVQNPMRIEEIKRKSRQFVENFCECSIVVEKYMNSVGL